MSLETRTNDELAAWDRDHLLHPTTHIANHARDDVPGRIIASGEGVYIEDRDGTRYLDAFAALYCVNAGYGCRRGSFLMTSFASLVRQSNLIDGQGVAADNGQTIDVTDHATGDVIVAVPNAWQTCICTNRLFVQAGIYDRFVEAVASF